MSNLNPVQQILYLIWKLAKKLNFWPFSKQTEINSLASGGCWSGQGFTRKNQQLLFGKQNYLYSWEKKTEVKVHLQNFWNQKVSEKQKCSSRNFEIWNIFFFKYEKKFCFSKERGFFRLLFLNEIHRETIVVNFGKIQGQFVP